MYVVMSKLRGDLPILNKVTIFFPNITCVNYRVGPCYNCLCQLDFDDLYLKLLEQQIFAS